ncbi:hypothetical protein BCR36DRAFT_583738 [Piromyces finnis]|uniref:Uncharacterized protein n=1 Tax=Piromyces finnis TaxID=1754191 RepID=A0A1Y1V8I1_9FUNG|nr:hypothetical protein BCR36DRAFT_583738 [Piromyces finnis]|eukprot:ORX49670.1 hypothetical protein BCR36DRAFT_583738 [Piromyces finnis]
MKFFNILLSFLVLAFTATSIPIKKRNEVPAKPNMPGMEDYKDIRRRHRIFANKPNIDDEFNHNRNERFRHRLGSKYENNERLAKFMEKVNERKKGANENVKSQLRKRHLKRSFDLEDRLNFLKQHRNSQGSNVKINNKIKMADSRKSSRGKE